MEIMNMLFIHYVQYFTQDGPLEYCNNIPNFNNLGNIEYNKNEWQLFFVSSKILRSSTT